MKSLLKGYESSFLSTVRFILTLTLLTFVINMTIPQVAIAATIDSPDGGDGYTNSIQALLQEKVDIRAEKVVPAEVVLRTMRVPATAYTSAVEETDATPCITANGFDVCKNGVENVIAANFLKFGTKVRIPDMYGDRIFTVQDRMNARYTQRIDLWMLTKQNARQFGIRNVKIEILQ